MLGDETSRMEGGCPCGSAMRYDGCCGRLHRGDAEAGTAEQLMRARYSAFATRDEAYLLRTWHPSTRPPGVVVDPADEWLGLEVLASSGGGLLDAEGTVEFRARYRRGGQPGVVRERSRFARHDQRWVYVGPAGA